MTAQCSGNDESVDYVKGGFNVVEMMNQWIEMIVM